MTTPVVSNLIYFIAGCVVAVLTLLLLGQESWQWDASNQGRLFGIALMALVGVALVALYWSDTSEPTSNGTAARGRGGSGATKLLSGQMTDVNAAREELERQLGRLIVMIAGQLENSQDHVASLHDTNAHLATVTTVAEIREVVRTLIAKNETNERQTRDLEGRLKAAQAQATSLRQRLSQAEKLASLDPLTAVANRRRFEQFISAAIERSHANGTPLCLIMTDIDHFKRVNDKFGHAAGDKVLKAFADLLSSNVRGGDLVARYGGEEFAVVLPQTPMGDAFGIAERIRRSFELQVARNDPAIGDAGRLTASFGVAEIRDGEPPSALIQRADQMLYEAKDKGRNITMVWSTSATATEES